MDVLGVAEDLTEDSAVEAGSSDSLLGLDDTTDCVRVAVGRIEAFSLVDDSRFSLSSWRRSAFWGIATTD